MPFAFNGVRGSKQKFADYVLAQTTAVDHDLQALIAQYRLAHDSSATQCAPLDDIEVHTPDESILAEPIVSSVESEYACFVSKLGAADWVRHGHTYYSQAAGTTCPFCQQTLPTDFEQTLKACFDSEYDRKVQALETFSRAYKQATALLERMPLSRDLGPMPEQADLSTYDALVTALKDRISSNLNRIDNKLNAPSTTVVLQPLGELADQVRGTVGTINAAISEHNATVANQQTRRQECEVKAGQLVAHMLDQQIRRYNEEKDELADKQRHARKLEQDAKTRVSSSLREIRRLEATAVNTTAVMNQINEHLRRSKDSTCARTPVRRVTIKYYVTAAASRRNFPKVSKTSSPSCTSTSSSKGETLLAKTAHVPWSSSMTQCPAWTQMPSTSSHP